MMCTCRQAIYKKRIADKLSEGDAQFLDPQWFIKNMDEVLGKRCQCGEGDNPCRYEDHDWRMTSSNPTGKYYKCADCPTRKNEINLHRSFDDRNPTPLAPMVVVYQDEPAPYKKAICKDCGKTIEPGTAQLTNQCHVCEVEEHRKKTKKECVHRFEFFEVKPSVKTIIGDFEKSTKRVYCCVNCGLVTYLNPNN